MPVGQGWGLEPVTTESPLIPSGMFGSNLQMNTLSTNRLSKGTHLNLIRQGNNLDNFENTSFVSQRHIRTDS
jgi:hypothetical protein